MTELHRCSTLRYAGVWLSVMPGHNKAPASHAERAFVMSGEVGMVTITKDANRADLAEAMGHMTTATAALRRRGHEGTHKSCEDCARYGDIHAHLSLLITSWERAES